MAVGYRNVLYPSGSMHLLQGDFHLCTSSAGIYSASFAALISDNYTYSDLHDVFSGTIASGLPGNGAAGAGGNQIGSSMTMVQPYCSSSTSVAGVFDANDITFSGVGGAGEVVQSIVIYQGGVAGTNDYLLAHYGTGSGGTPINIITNGGDITIGWNSSGVLSISGGCP